MKHVSSDRTVKKTMQVLTVFGSCLLFSAIAQAESGSDYIRINVDERGGDLGVVVDTRRDFGGRSTDVKLEIKEGNGSYRKVRTEGRAPYEWGTENRNKSDRRLLDLDRGDYTLRATIQEGSKRGKSVTKTVAVRNSSSSNDSNDSRGMEFLEDILGLKDKNYVRLDRDFDGTYNTKGADYILVMKSHGHKNHNEVGASWFKVSGERKDVGVVGTHDKGMLLIDVKRRSKIKIDVNNSAVQLLHIYTSRDLKVTNPGIQGARDPSLNQTTVQGKKNRITFYAEDQGGKNENRNRDYERISVKSMGKGDDLLYIITGTKTNNQKGNGALMHISYEK